jgi:1,4-alpha-glucan branching enzyme
MSIGTFALVLHSHLPWVANHGRWPVGEEWLYQAWSHAYLPVVDVLRRLADEGRTHVLTLGLTPILAAQLDDPTCIAAQRTWLSDWQLRALGAAASANDQTARLGRREYQQAERAQKAFDELWQRGASPVIRPLLDAEVIEVLSGPATHPFLPLLDERVLDFSLDVGLSDTRIRLGLSASGIWAPECGYRPGLEDHYARFGIDHIIVDGPTLGKFGTDQPRRIGDSDVVAFGRNLEITYRIWSPRRGYPGGKWYRDFHTFDHEWGLRPARVTSVQTDAANKAPYDPQRAAHAVRADAADFIAQVRAYCEEHPGSIIVAAFDTELFGHWWHEGPEFLETILRGLPDAGIELATLAQLRDRATDAVALPAGSWGSGKDWRVWDGEQVQDFVQENAELQKLAIRAVSQTQSLARQHAMDQLIRELLLALSSDWAFMVSKDSAADYARRRFREHADYVRLLLEQPEQYERLQKLDGPFGHLDSRLLIGS